MNDMKSVLIIIILFLGFICIAQNDSVYNRYPDIFRFKSISLTPTYVGFSKSKDMNAINLNVTTSYKRHLFEVRVLDFDFKSDRSTINETDSFTRNKFNLYHFAYGYASVFSDKWHMHNTIGLGQIRVERSRNGQVLQNEKGINLRLGSTLFYDFNNRLAAGAALGYNLNTIENVPELGLALTYKFRNRKESIVIQERREIFKNREDSIKIKKAEKFKDVPLNKTILKDKIQFIAVSTQVTIYDNLNQGKAHLAGLEISYFFQAKYRISMGLIGLHKNLRDENDDRQRDFYRNFYLTYGKRFSKDYFFLEVNTGLSYFSFRKTKVLARLFGKDFETIEQEESIGLPIIMRAGLYAGNHFEIGVRTDYHLNLIKPTFSTGLFFSYTY